MLCTATTLAVQQLLLPAAVQPPSPTLNPKWVEEIRWSHRLNDRTVVPEPAPDPDSSVKGLTC